MMKSFATKELETIKKLATQEIPALIATGCDENMYNAKRAELNAHVIQLCVGGEIVELKGKKEGQQTFKFNKALPTKAQVAECSAIINTYIGMVENPFLMNLAHDDGDDDMSIQTGDVYAANVIAMEKPKNKDLKANILGTECIPYYQMKLSGLDVITLAAIGEEARKRANFQKTLIIGGIIVLLAVAGGVCYYFYTKKDECCEDCDCDIDQEDIDLDPDDAPVEVELD